MRTSRKLLAVLMAIALLLTSLPATLLPVSAETGDAVYTTAGYYGQLNALQREVYDGLKALYLDEEMMPTGVCGARYTDEDFVDVPEGRIYIELPDAQEWYFDLTSDAELMQISEKLRQLITAAEFALIYDYPQIFWGQRVSLKFSFDMNQDGSARIPGVYAYVSESFAGAADQSAAYVEGVRAAVSQILAATEGNRSCYTLYKAILDWIIQQVEYDTEALYQGSNPDYMYAHTSMPVFTGIPKYTVVCEGYAEAFKLLCDELRRETGYPLYAAIVRNEGHMWNAAYIDGGWYGVDCTTADNSMVLYEFFLAGNNTEVFGSTFSMTNAPNMQVEGLTPPALEDTAYVWTGTESEEPILPVTTAPTTTMPMTTAPATTLPLTTASSTTVPTTIVPSTTATQQPSTSELPSITPETTTEPVVTDPQGILLGDVNGDGDITSADARLALRSAVGLIKLQGVYDLAADVNGDEKVTSADARTILRRAVGLA